MRAMMLTHVHPLADSPAPLEEADWPVPSPGHGEALIRVRVCGVCHTELDEIEGRTLPPALPIVPGHQVIGIVEALGAGCSLLRVGDRVGVAWVHHTCGACVFCLSGRENLCPEFVATGRDVHGGYAELMTVPEQFAYTIPPVFSDAEAAPLLCAGAIGLRSLRLTGIEHGQNLGLTGFGSSAHIVAQLIRAEQPETKLFVFARNEGEREFARELGAVWTGDTSATCPVGLHAVIDTTPAWQPAISALRNLERGGTLVINAIRKEEHDKYALLDLDFPRDLWLEKKIQSVANVTRRDVQELLLRAAAISLRPTVEEIPLQDANRALLDLKQKKIRGAKVLRVSR